MNLLVIRGMMNFSIIHLIRNETEASGRKDLPDLSLKISMAKKMAK
jgi:hypothetical protein